VNDGVHAASLVYLIRKPSSLRSAAQIADHDSRGARNEVSHGAGALSVAGVQEYVMALVNEEARRQPAEPVC
jgi:hypothetical protein